MVIRGRTSPRRKTAVDCTLYGHSWHAGWKLGEQMCTVCGIKAYCAECVFPLPKGTRIHYCVLHQQQREMQE